MHVEMGRFDVKLELADADFEAYAPERTRATSMTAPRGAVKRRLLMWVRSIAAALAEEGIELDTSATDEHPSARNGHRVDAQSAYLFRAQEARHTMHLACGTREGDESERPELGQARIEVRVDANVVTLVLWLGGDARIDLENTTWALGHPTDDLAVVWGALADAALTIEARASLSPRARAVRDVPLEDAASIAKRALESDVPLVVGRRTLRADAIHVHALDAWDGNCGLD